MSAWGNPESVAAAAAVVEEDNDAAVELTSVAAEVLDFPARKLDYYYSIRFLKVFYKEGDQHRYQLALTTNLMLL